jgi:uncharacterized membrane protein YoaK (UPF0700 family)
MARSGQNGVVRKARRARLRRSIARASVITGRRRTEGADLRLATVLCTLAGAVNAGGFFAIGEYTSHMTGHLSLAADNLILGQFGAAAASAAAMAAFIAGAACAALLINWGRRRRRAGQYALPIAAEGLLLIAMAGAALSGAEPPRIAGLILFCFIMGLQNATITKISGARIRTTHVTGMVTDIGIELGRSAYGRTAGDAALRAMVARIGK